MLKDFYNDLTAFGSLIFSLFIIYVAFFTKNITLAVELALALTISYTITFPIKVLFFKNRPAKQTYRNILEKFDASSFPSLHSMRATSMAIPLLFFFNSLPMTLLVLSVVAAILYTRITLQKHFLTDVVAGAIIGIIVGTLILLLDLAQYITPFISFLI